MGIKCSLLGHSFTGTSVEEEREEQGSEVVITIKEVESCERCGQTRVISENKEVRSIESAAPVEEASPESEPDSEPVTDEPARSPTTDEPSPSPNIDAAEDDAEFVDDATEEQPAESDPEPASPGTAEPVGGATDSEQPAPAGTTEPAPEANGSPPQDDGVILDDGEDKPDRDPGEWPEETLRDEPERRSTEDVEWPEEDRGDDEEWDPEQSLTKEIDEAEVTPAGSATVTVPEGTFECPECGFTTLVEESSLRAGDFCPECHRGSLEHHPEE